MQRRRQRDLLEVEASHDDERHHELNDDELTMISEQTAFIIDTIDDALTSN